MISGSPGKYIVEESPGIAPVARLRMVIDEVE